MISEEIKIHVRNKIAELEQSYHIRIVYACESGSRAWGFASPDSDYDIRFIYTHPLKKYLSVGNYKAEMDFAVTNDIDLSGWELRKTLGLLFKSNATVFEWLQSPVVYHNEDDFREQLWQICPEYFKPTTLIYHYLGTVKSAYGSGVSDGLIKIKKYFYIIRPVLAALWVAEKEEIPPMEFAKLCELIENDPVYKVVQALLEQKKVAKEGERIALIPELENFIETAREKCELAAKSFEKQQFTTDSLDTFFSKTIGYEN
ncbi:MAG: nucleotidyltransferase [Thalassobius sp.]|nr:nucleotidyltransferase [Thalassovita sp.]